MEESEYEKLAHKSTSGQRAKLIVRRLQNGDDQYVQRVYVAATRKVYAEGVGNALLQYSWTVMGALFSCICLLKNWWVLHITLFALYLFAPAVVATLLILEGYYLVGDIGNPTKYFSRPKHAMFVAELNGEVVGTAGIKPANIKKKGKFANLRKEGDAELVRMNVSPDCQGQGISKVLLNAALDFAREEGYKRVVLTSTNVQHVATSIVYPKFGFVTEKEAGIVLGIKPVFMSMVL